MNTTQQFYFDRIVEKMKKVRPKAFILPGEKYVNAITRIKTQCEREHIFGLNPAAFMGTTSSWCLECSGKKPKTLEQYREVAVLKEGTYILNTIPKNCHTSVRGWKCKFGHIWSATFSCIQSGDWCAECYGNKPKELSDYKYLAISKNGEYILDEIHVPIEGWRCYLLHV